jgi:hypothetical protein
VSRVKVMFESKEGRLRSERDAARRQLEEAEAAREALGAQVGVCCVCGCGCVLGGKREGKAGMESAQAWGIAGFGAVWHPTQVTLLLAPAPQTGPCRLSFISVLDRIQLLANSPHPQLAHRNPGALGVEIAQPPKRRSLSSAPASTQQPQTPSASAAPLPRPPPRRLPPRPRRPPRRRAPSARMREWRRWSEKWPGCWRRSRPKRPRPAPRCGSWLRYCMRCDAAPTTRRAVRRSAANFEGWDCFVSWARPCVCHGAEFTGAP